MVLLVPKRITHRVITGNFSFFTKVRRDILQVSLYCRAQLGRRCICAGLTAKVKHGQGAYAAISSEVALMKVEQPMVQEYRPAEDEPFMNDRQVEYFRNKLTEWKNQILELSKETIQDMQADARNIPDVADRASEETDRALELRTRDRQRKVVAKIDAALRRIDEGSYGYCEVTGEPISLRRLDARPIATLSLEAQERHERREKVHRDD